MTSSVPVTGSSNGPLPLVFGITGHRNPRIDTIPHLEKRLRTLFTDMRRRYPDTPFILLSSLAEGADRIAAIVAIESGIQLIVPLPMKREIYEEDFETEESRLEFSSLLDQASYWFELPLLNTPEHLGIPTNSELDEDDTLRAHQYEHAGAIVAHYSNILIAMWDGTYNGLAGGTSRIVDFALQGVPREYLPVRTRLDPDETTPVYHILTPREGTDQQHAGQPGDLLELYPEEYSSNEAAQSAYRQIFENVDLFNRDVLTYQEPLTEATATSKSYVVDQETEQQLDNGQKQALSLYAIADALAIYYQGATFRIAKVLFSIALVAATIFNVYVYYLFTMPTTIIVFFATLSVAYLIYRYSSRNKYQHRYQDYRALAEGLRVQLYWFLAGIRESVSEHYLGQQRTEMDWIRNSLRGWMLSIGITDARVTGQALNTAQGGYWKTISEYWVDSQSAYFTRSSRREERSNKKMSKLGNSIFFSGLLLAALHCIYQFTVTDDPLIWVLLLTSVLPIAAGLLFGYAENRAYSDHAKQYQMMGTLFTRAKEYLDLYLSENRYDEAQELMKELGKAALSENGQWVLIHRERPVEMQKV